MKTRQGDRGAFGGTPGVVPTPTGTATGFNINRDSTGARLSNYTFNAFKTVIRQESASAGITDFVASQVVGNNCYRFWETTQGQESYNVSLLNSRVIGFERNAIRWFAVHGGLIDGLYAEGNQGGAFIGGISIEGQCSDVTIKNTEVRNCFDKTDPDPLYSQGDGILVEGGQARIVIQDTRVIGTGDGGYDLKAIDMDLLGTLYAEDNGRGFRFHRVPRMSTATLVVKGSRGRGFWFQGQSGGIYPDLPVADIGKTIALAPNGASSLYRFESGAASIRVLNYDIVKEWRGIKLQENGGSGYGAVTFPNGGRVEQNDGTWITYPGAPPTGSGGVIL